MRSPLTEHERLQYLEALGIDAWRSRDAAGPAADVAPPPEPQCAATPAAVDVESRQPAAAQGSVSAADWDSLRRSVAGCTLCGLHAGRTQTVFGVGSEAADLLVIGEAPGAEEDRRGEPFVGRAGKLLDEMLRAIGLDRRTVFIANVLKCRPPGNRDPQAGEAASCRPYLDRQIELVAPRVILAVGRIAAQQLLGSDLPLGRMRGQRHLLEPQRIPVIVTYHPAYLLRSPAQKRKAWADLCAARELLDGGAA